MHSFRLRSFVKRDSRLTAAQSRAYDMMWPQYGLSIAEGQIAWEQEFGRQNVPRVLEIGFGSGHSLLALAKACPDKDFIGIETHKPGIGALLLGMQANALTNIRIYHADAIDVLNLAIPDASLDGVQIFFPDPWPKRRHHARRLIQLTFVSLVVNKMKTGAVLHLATDWEDYAHHMMRVMTAESRLINQAGDACYAIRSVHRPTLTKFECRAIEVQRKIWDLQFEKK